MKFEIPYYFLFLVGALFFSCDNDDYPYAEIPSVVLNEFEAEFPKATDVEFKKLGKNYEVEFELDQRDSKTLITPLGTILREKKEISWNRLPAKVQSFLEKEFGQQDIKDPELVKSGDTVYYQAQISQFLRDKKIVINELGTLNHHTNYWK